MRVCFLLVVFLSICAHAKSLELSNSSILFMKHAAARILLEDPEMIECWIDDKLYLNPQKILINHQEYFSCESDISLPFIFKDTEGFFILCSKEEAEEHYDKAREALIDGIGHAAAAGVLIQIPPLAIYEGYQSVRSFVEMGDEYCKGIEAEKDVDGNH